MKAKNLIFIVAIAFGLVCPAHAFDEGTVKGSKVNVRGQATLNSEVVTQLNNGESVVIIEQVRAKRAGAKDPKYYYKIALPASTPVWVSAAYVKDNKVSATRLNVRSGPGENFSVLGRLTKGTPVVEIRKMDQWLEIEATDSVHGFVATSLVNKKERVPEIASAPTSFDPVPVPPSVPVIPEPVVPSTTPAFTALQVEEVGDGLPAVSAPITNFEPVTPAPAPVAMESPALAPVATESFPTGPNSIISETTVTTVSTAPATPDVQPNPLVSLAEEPEPEPTDVGYRTIDPNKPKKTWFGRWWQDITTKKKRDEQEAAEAAASKGKFHEPPPVAADGPPPVRVVSREGVVVRSWNIQAPSDWALKEVYTGRIVNYLWTTHTNIPWQDLKGRTVIISGEEAIDRRWKRTPVLRIETLKTIDNDGEG